MSKRGERLTTLAGHFETALRALGASTLLPRQVEAAVVRITEALVQEVKTDGPLDLTVAETGMSWVNQPLGAGSLAAAIAQPLFRDGVRAVSFLDRLTAEEALRLVRVWVRTARGPMGTDGFATRAWETEKGHVRLTMVPPARAVSEAAGHEAEKLAHDWLSSPLAAAFEVTRSSDERLVPTLKALEALELMPETVTVQTPDWLQKVAQFSELLTRPRTSVARHFGETLMRAAEHPQGRESELLPALYERVVRSLATELRFADAVEVFQHASAVGHSDAARAMLQQLRASLTSTWFMAHLVAAIDVPETSADALEGVRHMGPTAARSLLAAPQLTPDGKRRLASLVAQLEADTSQKAHSAATAQLGERLEHLAELSTPEAAEVINRALHSPESPVRRRALEVMQQPHAALLAQQLHGRLADPSSEVRALAIKHLAELEDPTALPALVVQLHRPTVAPAERVLLYDALARIGGPRAGHALADELQKQTDVALKVEAARALGRIDHPQARDVLEAEARRTLGNAELKKACREVLSKLGPRP